jgi:CspA family cold shock protein
MAIGIVKWFNASKGFGFLTPKDGSADIFVHVSSLERAKIYDLKEGQLVQYESAINKGRNSAVNLKLIGNE